MLRVINFALLALLVSAQYQLWLGDGGVHELNSLETTLEQQTARNNELGKRNQQLMAEVDNLRQGQDAVEEIAREDLGLIAEGEEFIRIVRRSDLSSQ